MLASYVSYVAGLLVSQLTHYLTTVPESKDFK